MIILLCVLIGIGMFCIGLFVGRKTTKIDGMFLINDSDDENTRWILDVKIDPETIPNKKEIRLKVRKIDEGVV